MGELISLFGLLVSSFMVFVFALRALALRYLEPDYETEQQRVNRLREEAAEENEAERRFSDWRERFLWNNKRNLPHKITVMGLTRRQAITVLEERLPRIIFPIISFQSYLIVCGDRHTNSNELGQQILKYLQKKYPNYKLSQEQNGHCVRITKS